MLSKIYILFHRLFSDHKEKNEHSRGYWQSGVRKISLSLCQDAQGRLIEIGCGEGLFLIPLAKQYPNLEILGVDNNTARIEELRQKSEKENLKNINLSIQDATRLNFSAGTFDTVICINTFFNMDSLSAVRQSILEMRRICKDSGRIIFDIRNSLNPLLLIKYKLARYYDATVKNLPLNCYNPGAMEGLLEELGMKVRRKRYIGSLLSIKFAPIIVYEAGKYV